MKLKSLFLAGLAVMAMTSCSNEDDAIVNGGENATKDAIFNFGIAFPTGTDTRATAGGSIEGTADESKVNDITLVLDYPGTIPSFVKTYNINDFTKNGSVYTLTNAELVAPGAGVAVTVYVNNGEVPTETLASTSAFDLGKYAYVAATEGEKSNFFMSGKAADPITIVAGSDENKASVSVDRVAAKLSEATPVTEGTEKHIFVTTASTIKNADKETLNFSIELTDYTFANLNKKSYALANADGTYFDAADFWNKFTPQGKEEQLWGTVFGEATKSMAGTDKDTYCFENNNTNAVPTKVYYKATASLEGVTTGANFYVHNNILYKDFTTLNAALFNSSLTSAFELTDESPNADFMSKVGVIKYTSGVCYYAADILTAGSNANILRNNSYVLTVKSIKDLGLPEIDTTTLGDPTLLILDVTVKNWTVNLNDIIL